MRRALEWDARVPHQDIQTAVSAAIQRLLGTVALRSPVGHLRRIDPAAPSPRLTLGYVVDARRRADASGPRATA